MTKYEENVDSMQSKENENLMKMDITLVSLGVT